MKKVLFSVCVLSGLSLSCFSQVEKGGSTPTFQKADTIRAVENLYKRKRAWGITKTILFGTTTAISVANIASDEPSPGQTDPGPAKTSTLIIASVSMVLTLNGISQISRYNHKNLEKQLTRYKDGKRLPGSIRSKLRIKDFR